MHTRQNTPVFDRFESVCESVLRSSDTSCETSIRTFWKFISAFQSRACAPGVDTRKTQQITQENIHIEYCPSEFLTISSQIQVCCSLIHSKESSIASGSRAITPYSKIAQRNFHFSRNIHIKILSEQILHYQLPNSGMLFFDILQRKLPSIWLKGYHAVFKNRPKKFSFHKKYTNWILSEQILHYQLPNSGMLFFDIF